MFHFVLGITMLLCDNKARVFCFGDVNMKKKRSKLPLCADIFSPKIINFIQFTQIVPFVNNHIIYHLCEKKLTLPRLQLI